MSTFIKDLNLSTLTAKIQPETFGVIRNNADLSRAVNLVAGIVDGDFFNSGKLPKTNKTPTELKYPIDIAENKEFDTYMKFTAVEQKHQKAEGSGADETSVRAINSPQSTILLNTPQNLAVTYERRWAQEELGSAQAVVAAASGGLVSALKEGVKQVAGRAADSAAKSGNSLTGANIQGTLEYERKGVINPRLKLLFKGINMRTFQFSFMFSPRSEQEVIQALGIVKSFKYYSAPYKEGILFHYPALFNIQMMRRSETAGAVENLMKFKTAACTSVTVDYSPNSIWATFKGGAPVSFRMDLNFTETDVVTRADIAPDLGA